MNKKELLDILSSRHLGIEKQELRTIVDGFLDLITEQLKTSEAVNLAGFGIFTLVDRAARNARNPKTGEIIEIPATKVVKFKPSKTLKDKILEN